MIMSSSSLPQSALTRKLDEHLLVLIKFQLYHVLVE